MNDLKLIFMTFKVIFLAEESTKGLTDEFERAKSALRQL
jgi:hypothetical protein